MNLLGKRVGIGLMGSYCKPTCAQARHAQCLDRTENDTISWASQQALL